MVPCLCFFLLLLLSILCRPPLPTLFPYTTLFRSCYPARYGVIQRYGAQYGVSQPQYGETSARRHRDRKSTRLNSSHLGISYAVFCLKKKKRKKQQSEPVAPAYTATTYSAQTPYTA